MRRTLGPVTVQATWDWREIGLALIVSLKFALVEIMLGPLDIAVWPSRDKRRNK